MIFYFNHFSLIIFYHSVWLGFELFGLRVQVHSIGHSLRLRAKDMTITIVKINPRQEMRLEHGWCHAQKRWAENFENFEKDSLEVRPWCREVEVRPWCWEVEVWPVSWELKLDHVGRRLSFCHGGREVEFLFHWGIKLDLGYWRCS